MAWMPGRQELGIDSYHIKRNDRWYRTNGVWASIRKAEAQREELLYLSIDLYFPCCFMRWVAGCFALLLKFVQSAVEVDVGFDVVRNELDNRAEIGDERSF
jgi:hypothetical protein